MFVGNVFPTLLEIDERYELKGIIILYIIYK